MFYAIFLQKFSEISAMLYFLSIFLAIFKNLYLIMFCELILDIIQSKF